MLETFIAMPLDFRQLSFVDPFECERMAFAQRNKLVFVNNFVLLFYAGYGASYGKW